MTDLSSAATATGADNLIAAAALALAKRLDEVKHGMPNQWMECRLKVHVQRLVATKEVASKVGNGDARNAENALTVWVSLVLAQTTEKGSTATAWA